MADFSRIFAALKPLLAKHAADLRVTHDAADHYALDTPHIMKNKKPLFFGEVRIRKAYVAFHLMPVYSDVDLLDGAPAALRARMQGKSCFSFRQIDRTHLEALAALTDAGAARYRAHGYF